MQCYSSVSLKITTVVCERGALWKKIHKWVMSMVVFWVFFVIAYKVMLKTLELSSANVELKYDAFNHVSEV